MNSIILVIIVILLLSYLYFFNSEYILMKDQIKDEKEYMITAYHDDECRLKIA